MNRFNVTCNIWVGNTLFHGQNSDKTSPRYRRECPDGNIAYARHAEMHALDKLPYDVNPRRIRVYVLRFNRRGEPRMAMPCKDCQYRLFSMGIKPRQIWFTNELGQMERLDNRISKGLTSSSGRGIVPPLT